MSAYEWEDFCKRVQTLFWFQTGAFLLFAVGMLVHERVSKQQPIVSVIALMMGLFCGSIALFAREYIKDLAWSNQDRRDHCEADE